MLFSGVAVTFLAGPAPVFGAVASSLQSILDNTHGSKDYEYPTDLTRDILPVSHFIKYPFCRYLSIFCVSNGSDVVTVDIDPRSFT